MMCSEFNRMDQEIGRRIRAARENDRQSIEQLSARVGILSKDLERIETGTSRASATLLARLSSVLGLEIRVFFEDCCNMQYRPSVALIKRAKSRGLLANLIEAEKQRKGGLRAA